MTRTRVEHLELELPCPKCGSAILVPASKLLEMLPGEQQGEYAARMRREWKRETSRPRRRRTPADEDRDAEDIRAVLGF